MKNSDRRQTRAPQDHTTASVTRREFIAAACTIAGLPLTGASPTTPTTMTERKIALQLYTIREEIEKDLRGSLKKIADLGFQFVETAFWPKGVSHEQAAQYLKEAGLTTVASHIEIADGLRSSIPAIGKAYGCGNMIWHGWPEDARYGSLEGTRELLRIYNETAALCRVNGLTFGLHNHWWEFMNRPGGKFVFEHWLENLDPSVFFEVDTYWVKVAGHDPAAIIRRLGSRVKFLHIKDGPAKWHPNLAADNPDPMTAVGKGAQDMPAILSAARDHDPWLVIEMDKTSGNVFEQLKESLAYLRSH